MQANAVQQIITNGITSYGNEMLIISASVVVVIVGFFVLRYGLNLLRSAVDPRAEFGDIPRKGEKWGVPGRSD